MKIAIMQPYFLPYIGYFQLMNVVDKFILYDDVNYINRGWVNRNRILINGQPNLVTIPLIQATQNKLINEIEVSNEGKWKEKLLKKIRLAYAKAPFFKIVFPILEKIINTPEKKVSIFIAFSLRQINEYLELPTIIQETSTIYKNNNLKGQHRILDICMKENAQTYINPFSGKELYDKRLFKEKGVELFFLKPQIILYSQFKTPFVPFLSIIDVMMFNPINKIKQFLTEYERK